MAIESEAQRQFYLGVAGIQLWYARAPQPGAAPSPEFNFDLDEPAGTVGALAPPSLPASPVLPSAKRQGATEGLARLQGLMKGESRAGEPEQVRPGPAPDDDRSMSAAAGSSSEVVESSAPLESAAPDDVSALLSAHWRFWSGESFVLVSTLSDETSEQLQDQLAKNILKAVGDSVDLVRTIHWPVFGNPQVPGNDSEGLRMLLNDIGQQFAGKTLVTLGLLPEQPADQRATWLGHTVGAPQVELPYGLAAMATDPERKRALWLRLKPLTGGRR